WPRLTGLTSERRGQMIGALRQSSFDSFGTEWRLPQAHAGGIEHGVADYGRSGVRRWFAGAVGWVFRAVVDQHDVDGIRYFVEAQNRVVGPVATGDMRVVECHF